MVLDDAVSLEPHVRTLYGEVEGILYETKEGCKCDVFLGVPYAQPPSGELRFEKPQRLKPWNGTLKAKEFKSRCYPHCQGAMEPKYFYSEDCLYLNIMTPHGSNMGCPVIVYIHGGGFVSGGTNPFGYGEICDNFVAKGFVFVTLAYRIGFLGFFTNGTNDMPGNYGLWDQREALIYVHDNIGKFGGDPENVTIMGTSAGAASVSALSLSPYCKGLFKRGICLSGSAYCGWVISDTVCENCKEILQKLGCSIQNAKAELKMVEIAKFMDAVTETEPAKYNTASMVFHPRIDGDFFPRPLDQLVEESDDIPIIFGLHGAESASGVLSDAAICMWNMYVPKQRWTSFLLSDFSETVKRLVITRDIFGDCTEEVQELVIDFYKNQEFSCAHSPWQKYLNRLVQLLSDVQFNVPVYIDAQLRRLNGKTQTYLFKTDYFREEVREHYPVKGTKMVQSKKMKDMYYITPAASASYHCDEFKYLFGFSVAGEFELNSDDLMFQAFYLDFISNFARNGDPSTRFGAWLAITRDSPLQCFRFNLASPSMIDAHMKDRINFWTEELPHKTGSLKRLGKLLPGLDVLAVRRDAVGRKS